MSMKTSGYPIERSEPGRAFQSCSLHQRKTRYFTQNQSLDIGFSLVESIISSKTTEECNFSKGPWLKD
jgi:hypothetical protein